MLSHIMPKKNVFIQRDPCATEGSNTLESQGTNHLMQDNSPDDDDRLSRRYIIAIGFGKK
jgi:hypothetical protein